MKAPIPNLFVKSVTEAVSFYRDLLGFELLCQYPETGEPAWALLKNGNANIMVQEQKNAMKEYPALASPKLGGTFTLYFDVTDVQKIYDRVKGKANMPIDMHKTPYGANEFAITDRDGYMLVLAQHPKCPGCSSPHCECQKK